MATVKKFPTLIGGSTGGWSYADKLKADDGDNASVTSALGNYEIYGYGFGFDIPIGSVIQSIKMMWEGQRVGGSAGECSCQLGIGDTKIGIKHNIPLPSIDMTIYSFDGAVSVEDLNSDNLRMYLSAGYPYMLFDYMAIEVEYIPFEYKPFGQII